MSVAFIAPIRCQNCGVVVKQKPGSKVPKNCPPCRHAQQETFKQKVKASGRTRRN